MTIEDCGKLEGPQSLWIYQTSDASRNLIKEFFGNDAIKGKVIGYKIIGDDDGKGGVQTVSELLLDKFEEAKKEATSIGESKRLHAELEMFKKDGTPILEDIYPQCVKSGLEPAKAVALLERLQDAGAVGTLIKDGFRPVHG